MHSKAPSVEPDLANSLKSKMCQPIPKATILLGVAVLIFVFSFMIGRYPISPGNLIMILAARFFPIPRTWPSNMDIVVLNVRLPRILAALLVGAALATSGAAYQGMFRNPLVSPDILGAAMGAGFGACLGIYFSFNVLGIQLTSFYLRPSCRDDDLLHQQ